MYLIDNKLLLTLLNVQGQDSLQRSFFLHIRDQVLHEIFLAEGVQDIIPLDDIIIKDACRLESGIDCLLRQLQTCRQVTDTVCYEIKLIRAHAKCECLLILLHTQRFILSFLLCTLSETFP